MSYSDDDFDKNFKAKFDYYNEVARKNKLRMSWSLFEVDDLCENHPFGDIKILTYDPHTFGKKVSVSVSGTRWLDLYIAADKAMRASGDRHHTFIEQFEKVVPDTVDLWTGS